MDIVIVDDEREIADLLGLYLSNEGFAVHKFYNGQDALNYIDGNHVDLGCIGLFCLT